MAAPRERPQPGLAGALLSADLLPRAGAQRLQVEADAILGEQGIWMGGLEGSRENSKQSKQRAVTTFILFMANCCARQFLR